MAVKALRQQAADELRELLQSEASAFPGLEWVRLALQTPGKLLSSDSGGFTWGLLPLLVIEAAGGQPRTGMPLAAAADCLIAASDVLDDVEDGDAASGLERVCGIPTAINVATFLVFMGQVAIHRLADQGLRAEVVCAVGRVLARAAVRACGGQQRDINQDDELLSESGYLEMVEAKSGALVEGLCHAAAIVAGASSQAIGWYAQFGRNLGIALQISNDVRAVSIRQHQRNDLALGKRTLPLVFALEHAPTLAQQCVRTGHAQLLEPSRGQRLADLLERGGGILYASVVADVHFEKAVACLEQADSPKNCELRGFLRLLRK
jgi:competence protein ComQ